MPKRGRAVHVATTTRRYKNKVYRTHLLRRTFRQDGRVKHETLGNISHLPDSVIKLIRRALKGETFVNPEDRFHCTRSLPHGHVAAVLATLKKLKLDSLLARSRSRDRDLIVALIVARVIDAQSKLATARALSSETALSTLSATLGLGPVDENEIYGAMDRLLGPRQEAVENALARRHLQENTLVLYDVTSCYLEGRRCELAQRGYSRDGKRGKLQIVIGLLCSPQGCPVAVEVFKGSTGDPSTVASQVHKIRSRFGLRRIVLVGDRGMLTAARIREDLQGVEGLHWITALRAPTIRSLVKEGTVQPSLFDQRDLAEVTSDQFPGERLIVCYNPLLAYKRRRKRQELLAATEKKLEAIVEATQRPKRALRGEDKIGVRVGREIHKHKMAKHFLLEITETSFEFRRNPETLEVEEALDGIYIVRTNVEPEWFSADETVRAYKDLSKVEQAFRCMKSVDLKIRPLHHRRPDRVRAHVFLCLLAYYVEWHMRVCLAPILFDDHDREAAEQERSSVVAPAVRSRPARDKASRKRTEDDLPVHSFRTLLQDLGTLAQNTLQVENRQDTFMLKTQPTELQRRAFQLLGVKP